MTEDEMVGWHHQLNGHEFGWTLGVGDGQGSLACCSPWGRKESGTTERLNSLSILRASLLALIGITITINIIFATLHSLLKFPNQGSH